MSNLYFYFIDVMYSYHGATPMLDGQKKFTCWKHGPQLGTFEVLKPLRDEA
jgi:hypothetical protein